MVCVRDVRLRYIAAYAGPWVGCGGELDVKTGTRFSVMDVDGDDLLCKSMDEELVNQAKQLEKLRIAQTSNPARMLKLFLGIDRFRIPYEVITDGRIESCDE